MTDQLHDCVSVLVHSLGCIFCPVCEPCVSTMIAVTFSFFLYILIIVLLVAFWRDIYGWKHRLDLDLAWPGYGIRIWTGILEWHGLGMDLWEGGPVLFLYIPCYNIIVSN
ncbi:hypothetical protein BO71DRAFT_100889 [Aspergillus ellipticus CBS 707.79]|uniref:Uncharacterized protein n=1 Tax=Aspergillus ellipticus CBS 707.79 TaxID=1448320 RepID=A0A319EFB1_9EURO|nr:hypothetical protein BO71DRAFT_100889 [Aspergillus ellipticus CBS 707.79]